MKYLVILILFSFLFFGCKKDDPKDDSSEPCNAGPGGDVSLTIYPKYNGSSVYGQSNYMDTAYIRYNATNFPGDNPALYNYIVAGQYSENFVRVEGLKCGIYYVFTAGYDTSVNARVKGGMPVVITETSGNRDIVIAVNP